MSISLIRIYTWTGGRRRWVGWRLWQTMPWGGRSLASLRLLWWRS